MTIWGGINLSPIIKVAAATTPQQSLRALWYKEGKSPEVRFSFDGSGAADDIVETVCGSARNSGALQDPREDPMDLEEARSHEKVQEKPCGMTTGRDGWRSVGAGFGKSGFEPALASNRRGPNDCGLQ
ncbi:hypothetical protein DdX_14948 [Ditylenchus destructor]|uniref:Uncharacterized protein n=1 Tax=Ditylenchus destructor TaxID=166010 RepID=A0AAD4MTQ0_9BILA|nr:hypothetical protein DdX_14948 [Ditylenchus destructor]